MKLLKNQEIEEQIIGIIKEAKNSIVFVSPYINFCQGGNKWEELFDLLSQRSKEGLFIEVHARENQNNSKPNEPDTNDKNIIKKFNGITLGNVYLHMNLHAKLYFNEEKAIVTTLNILQSSRNNIEIGYLIEKEDKKERDELLNGFYYPVLLNIYPELIDKNDNLIIKNRRSYLVENLHKLVKDIEISADDNGNILKVYNKNYEIEMSIEEEQVACELPDDMPYDVAYRLFFCITIKNESYKIEYIEKQLNEDISQGNEELVVATKGNNNIAIHYNLGSFTHVYSKNLLTDNFWFDNVNRGLFYLIKILEENKNCT
jgi:hypothetical protein